MTDSIKRHYTPLVCAAGKLRAAGHEDTAADVYGALEDISALDELQAGAAATAVELACARRHRDSTARRLSAALKALREIAFEDVANPAAVAEAALDQSFERAPITDHEAAPSFALDPFDPTDIGSRCWECGAWFEVVRPGKKQPTCECHDYCHWHPDTLQRYRLNAHGCSGESSISGYLCDKCDPPCTCDACAAGGSGSAKSGDLPITAEGDNR